MTIEIPSLLGWQERAVTDATRLNLVCAGRQSGKSMLLIELVYESIVKATKVALIFPTYKSLWHHWQRIANTFHLIIINKNESRMMIIFQGGASLECFSAESMDTIRGNQFDEVIIDEAAHIVKLQELVESIVMPALLVRSGSLWMLSTPKGTQNYFNTCKNSEQWRVTTATSFDNPYILSEDIERLKLTMSPERVQQELLGIPVDETALLPFFYAYSVEQHFVTSILRELKHTLWFSFDFNVGIMSCVVAQSTANYRTEVLALIQLRNSSVEGLCKRLRELYPLEVQMGRVLITGDASGNNRSGYFTGNLSYYQVIKKELQALDYQFKVPHHNLGHAQSQQLVNSIIHSGLVKVGSPELNRQIKALTIDDGGIVKDGNDHGTDCFRYLLHSLYNDFISKPHKYLNR